MQLTGSRISPTFRALRPNKARLLGFSGMSFLSLPFAGSRSVPHIGPHWDPNGTQRRRPGAATSQLAPPVPAGACFGRDLPLRKGSRDCYRARKPL